MNKLLLFSGLKDYGTPMPEVRDYSSSDVVDTLQPLYKYIYGTDPVTGLPVGDLSVYLGDKANPEIKAFIEQQLLKPVSDPSSDVSMPTEVVNRFRELSDDDVAKYTRNHGESREDYADRLRYYFAQERELRLREKNNKSWSDLYARAKIFGIR